MIGLESWTINLSYKETVHIATTEVEPRYRILTIYFNPDKVATYDDLEELVVHELCHALTWRLWDFADHLVEQNYADRQFGPFDWFMHEIHEEAVSLIGHALLRVWNAAAKSVDSPIEKPLAKE